ncbi:MAG: DNA topoisomerase I, partial [Candidatus Nealsonbacteria bacterium CG23_combo_of_CG06-09_8_20_14_all_39_25]
MRLILVESPAKSRTIKQFLGKEYQIAATMGHVRDLPEDDFGLEVENDFKPKYVIPFKSRKIIQVLKKEVEKADLVIVSTDPDREGEAIAWHLTQILNLNGEKPYQRIVF